MYFSISTEVFGIIPTSHTGLELGTRAILGLIVTVGYLDNSLKQSPVPFSWGEA